MVRMYLHIRLSLSHENTYILRDKKYLSFPTSQNLKYEKVTNRQKNDFRIYIVLNSTVSFFITINEKKRKKNKNFEFKTLHDCKMNI